MLESILALGFNDEIFSSIRIRAFYIIGDCLRSNPLNHERLEMSSVPKSSSERDDAQSSPKASIVYLTHLTVGKDVEFHLRIAALYVLECYLYRNSGAQISLIASMMTPLNEGEAARQENTGFANLLFGAIELWDVSRKNPFECWCSCVLLSHCLQANRKAKEMALNVCLSQDEGNERSFSTLNLLSAIVHFLMFSSQDQADIRIQFGFLSLLCVWLYECPDAVAGFLKESAHLQFVRY